MNISFRTAAATAAVLLSASSGFAQTTSDTTKQPAQSLSHSAATKQSAQSLAHSAATKQKAQSFSHADPSSNISKQQ